MTVTRVDIAGLRLVSEANARGSWHRGAKRAASQREVVALHLRTHRAPRLDTPGAAAVVRIVRIAPCALDNDNLARAAKAIRDEVARWLGVDDRDPRVTWHVGQRKGVRAREYGVTLHVRALSPGTVGARVRDAGLETVAEVTLTPAHLRALAAAATRAAEASTPAAVTLAVGELRLVLARTPERNAAP